MVTCIVQGFYDKSGKPSYNCLAAIDYRKKFCYLGVFSGSNSDQSMWNQSEVLGPRAREICPPGINWLGDSGFKLWPFLMVPFDERGGQRLTRKQRWCVIYRKAVPIVFAGLANCLCQRNCVLVSTITSLPPGFSSSVCLANGRLASKSFMA